MPVTSLNLLNRSLCPYPADIVLFDSPDHFDEWTMLLPWLYIRQCPPEFNHPFEYDTSLTIRLRDDWGNFSPDLSVEQGMSYSIVKVGSNERFLPNGSSGTDKVEIFNDLPQGAPSIFISRGDRSTAYRSNLAPGEFFSFSIPGSLLARKVSGQLSPQRLRTLAGDNYSSLLPLNGVRSADILLSGGGTGAKAQRYMFKLVNIIN